MTDGLSPDDLNDLAIAVRLLEHPGFVARLSELMGKPIESGIRYLPQLASEKIHAATNAALREALRISISSLGETDAAPPSPKTHKMMAGLSGAVGGAFGLPAFLIELPVSTVIMLRAIADIARAQGEDIRSPEAQLACIEVFALGGKTTKDDGSETGYFAVRAALAREITAAAEFIAKRGMAEEGAPILLKFISRVASRYSIAASEKAAAQMVPIIGAVLGGAINLLFTDHFQEMAFGHFTVRRLERIYGKAQIQDQYQLLLADMTV